MTTTTDADDASKKTLNTKKKHNRVPRQVHFVQRICGIIYLSTICTYYTIPQADAFITQRTIDAHQKRNDAFKECGLSITL